MAIRKPNYTLFWLGIALLIIGTFIFRYDDGAADKFLIDRVYAPDAPAGQRFPIGNTQPWHWLNRNDGTFTIILSVILLGLLVLGLTRKKYKALVRYTLFGLTSLILGPGLIVNVIFKEFWGRPRPSQTVLWPNSENPENLPFYKVWDPAFLNGLDKPSFPSGHVSVTVIYIVIFYIFKHPEITAHLIGEFKKFKIRLFTIFKYTGLVLAFPGGLIMGFARMSAGAHHPSDVLWTFGMVLLINRMFYYFIFKIPFWEEKEMRKIEKME
jgi:lipid A 4'-phosphatase